jgi:hypothetical protein
MAMIYCIILHRKSFYLNIISDKCTITSIYPPTRTHGVITHETTLRMVSSSCTAKWVFNTCSGVLRKYVIIFWDITPCSPLKVNRLFGGTYRLHLHGRKISRVRNHLATCFHNGFLLGLFLDHEDGGEMFLRNVS